MKGDLTRTLAAWLDSGGREFGEIAISRPGDGFDLQHRDDSGRDDLVTHHRAEDARLLANFDDAGVFRPLKTAPNLRHGWRLVLPDLRALRRALDYFYPAMLGVWCSQQRGQLAAVPLRETLGRQTGMYRVTQKISDADAQTLVGGFCRSEDGCLKTILWPLESGKPITALPPGKFAGAQCGDFPLLCHEACNLLVAKAREVVKKSDSAR